MEILCLLYPVRSDSHSGCVDGRCDLMKRSLIIAAIIAALFSAYKCGIRHAMTEAVVSVYLDGRVEIQLDGDVYEHIAF